LPDPRRESRNPDGGTDLAGEPPSGIEVTGLDASLLENPVRRRIVERLDETPGLNNNQLSKRVGVPWNLLRFHLQRLADAGLVVVREGVRGEQKVCFLAKDEHLWERDETRVLFGRRSNREVALIVARNPGATVAEIAEAVDLTDVTVRYHLETLRDHGLVERIRTGRSYDHHPTEALKAWVDEVGEVFEREDA
jgi:DNA-binding transcriptional ArsR family regulator